MSFLGALFGGSNPTLNQNINNTGQIAGFETTTGEGDIGAASNFWRSLLSGDMSKIGKLLAPQIAGIQKRAQQQKQTASQFGNRSGGTNAEMQTVDDSAKAEVGGMISDLTGKAASEVGSMGTTLLGMGENTYMDESKLSQQRMENWLNSILGRGITEGVSAAESYGLNKLFPTSGGGGSPDN